MSGGLRTKVIKAPVDGIRGLGLVITPSSREGIICRSEKVRGAEFTSEMKTNFQKPVEKQTANRTVL
jgi:hypothetical protein